MGERLYNDKREDTFQRILVTFFFKEKLQEKERKLVLFIVRFVSSVVILVLGMLTALLTESIAYFFWVIVGFLSCYVILRILGFLRNKLSKK